MFKTCDFCGASFNTPYHSKRYCSEACARKAYYNRDVSDYDCFIDDNAEPIFSFECAECGSVVKVYSRFDQRNRFCCGKCAAKFIKRQNQIRLAKQRYNHNLGMSGGMSLNSLIRREAISAPKEKVIFVKTCPVCGKRFETKYDDKKYCSDACNLHAKYKRRQKKGGVNLA